MWFLMKAGFWLAVVVLLIPAPAERPGTPIDTGETIGAIATAMQDAKGFCTRNPEACVAGGAALQSFGERASNGARMLHEFIAERVEENRQTPPPAAGPAAAPAPPRAAAVPQPPERPRPPARETLTERDRAAMPVASRS